MYWTVILWYLVAGVLLVAIGAGGPLLKRVWLSTSVLYLAVGLVIGPSMLGLLGADLIVDARPIEHITEIAVIISLFAAGLKMRLPLADWRWLAPLLLATLTMTVTITLASLVGYFMLGLSLGMAVLLGAVLAPTDPVLASEVQLTDPDDKDRLRLMLTGEAGLNDGMAFPFVLLAVGLVEMTLHPLGDFGWRWVSVDVLWRILGGLGLGWVGGYWLGKMAIWMRKRQPDDLASDEMLSLGMIAFVYGAALAIQTYAFLAVFAAAVALRQVELARNRNQSNEQAVQQAEKARGDREADKPEHAPALLVRDQVSVADSLEKLVQITLVVLVGALIIPGVGWNLWVWGIALLMIFVVRPMAVYLTTWRREINASQRALTAWFGLRGIGTLYYLTHAYGLGVAEAEPEQSAVLAEICLATIAVSVVVHGLTVKPLMDWYARR